MTSIKRALEAAAGVGGAGLDVEDVFKTLIYSGDGTNPRTLTTGLDMAGEGGMIWTKVREGFAEPGTVQDTEQGATEYIVTSTEAVQDTLASSVQSFTSTGYTVGNASISNNGAYEYVSWNFRKAEGFFDVVKWTADATFMDISHNIGAVPGLIIYKCLSQDVSDDGPWHAWSVGQSNNDDISFNTDAAETGGVGYISNATSTQVTLYVTSGQDYVAYFFGNGSEIFGEDGDESIIKAGSFNTTASWGMYNLELGWEPQWVLLKKINGSGDWFVMDSMRGINIPEGAGGDFFENTGGFYSAASTSDDQILSSNNNAEEGTQGYINLHSTGCIFPLGSTAEFIYVAIRRDMKTPEAGTDVFTPLVYSGGEDTAQTISFSMVPDVTTIKIIGTVKSTFTHARGNAAGKYLITNEQNSLGSASDGVVDFGVAQKGLWLPAGGTGTGEINGGSAYSYICEAFKRAPGFLDVVTYTGTGVVQTIKHGLGIVPTMMWVKQRSAPNENWACYGNADNTAYAYLNLSNGFDSAYDMWDDTSPTDSVFTVGTYGDVNTDTETYIAYLWGSVTGVSEVGSYSGTGVTQNIDCGFTARYVMIKRFDTGGAWIYLDSARGLTPTPTEPFLRYNDTASEITWDDYVRGHADGFTVVGTSGASNASGGTYIFIAIA